MADHVTILLAAYNGAQYLGPQLDSIVAQDHDDWSVILSDDGSQDDTRAVAARYGRVSVVDGPRRGATQNFLSALARAPEGLAAFCDQDDIWLRPKLGRAVAALAGETRPALYCARTILCDETLRPIGPSRYFRRPHGFRNALVQACTPGNTCVMNAPAVALLQAALAAAQHEAVESHEWWAYQMITGAGGRVIWDAEPVLMYRQHGRNAMGRNDTLRARSRRATMLMDGSYRDWLGANARALAAHADCLTAQNRDLLAQWVAGLARPGPVTARMIGRLGLYRMTTGGDLALRLAAASGRLRQTVARPKSAQARPALNQKSQN